MRAIFAIWSASCSMRACRRPNRRHRPSRRGRRTETSLITWEFPRLCRGGSRSLTYTAVVLRKTCDGLRHDVIPAGQQGKASTAEIGDAVGETQSDAFIRDHFSWISWRGADVLMGIARRFGHRNWGSVTGLSKPL